MPNAYATFVKDHIHEFSHLPSKERMKECAKLYHEMKGNTMPMKKVMTKKRVTMKKNIVVPEGAGLLGDIIPFGHLLGLGLDTEMKPSKARKPKGGNLKSATMMASGGNFLDDFAQGFAMPFKALANVVPLVSHLL